MTWAETEHHGQEKWVATTDRPLLLSPVMAEVDFSEKINTPLLIYISHLVLHAVNLHRPR